MVTELSKIVKVFISSEAILPFELQKYILNIPPEKMHNVLAFANLYIGEGATMASECAMLGTPAIYVNSITAGTLEEQEKYGLIYFWNEEMWGSSLIGFLPQFKDLLLRDIVKIRLLNWALEF